MLGMSQEPAQPTSEPTIEAPAAAVQETPPAGAPTAKPSRAETIARINAELAAVKSKTPAEPAAAADEPAGEGETPPEPPPSNEAKATTLAKLRLEAQRTKSDFLKAKEAAQQSANRVLELEQQLTALKDPKAALKHAGTDAMTFAQQLIDGKIELGEPAAKVERDPEVQALIDKGKAAEARELEQAQAAEVARVRTENLKTVTSALSADGFAEQYPIVAAMPGAADKLLAWIESEIEQTKSAEHPDGIEPDFDVVAKVVNETVQADLLAYVKSKSALTAILKDPEARAAILAELGSAAPAPAAAPPAAKPAARATTLSSKVTAVVPSRTEKPTNKADKIAALNRNHFNR